MGDTVTMTKMKEEKEKVRKRIERIHRHVVEQPGSSASQSPLLGRVVTYVNGNQSMRIQVAKRISKHGNIEHRNRCRILLDAFHHIMFHTPDTHHALDKRKYRNRFASLIERERSADVVDADVTKMIELESTESDRARGKHVTCCLCMGDMSLEFTHTCDNSHSTCKMCLLASISYQTKGTKFKDNGYQLSCPITECPNFIPDNEIFRVAGKEGVVEMANSQKDIEHTEAVEQARREERDRVVALNELSPSDREIARLAHELEEDMNLRCPSGHVFGDYIGCLCLKCEHPRCETPHFCGICLRHFESDRATHDHVPGCNPVHPNSFFVSSDEFKAYHHQRRVRHAQRFLANIPSEEIRAGVRRRCHKLLSDLGLV